jgi:hypothetical protein
MDAVADDLTTTEMVAILASGRPLPPRRESIGENAAQIAPTVQSRPAGAIPRNQPSRPRRRRRWNAFNTFVDCSLRSLTRAEIVVWAILFRDTKDELGEVHTSQTDIATRGGLSRRAVVDAIKGLREKELLEIVRQGGMRRGMSSYRVRPLDRIV